MRTILQTAVIAVVALAGLFVAAKPVIADPSYGSDAAFPVPGVAANTVLGPIPGAPVFGPGPPPPIAVLPSLLTPPNAPGFGEVDDISYGEENPTYFPLTVEFSTGPGFGGAPTTGIFGGPIPPPPSFDIRTEAGILPPPPAGDGAVYSDIYAMWPGSVPFLPPCGVPYGNIQLLDGDGAGGPPFGPPRLGLNMPEPGSNIDAYERQDESAVTAVPGPPLIDAPIFFTIDAATAGAWGAPIPAPTGGPPILALPAPGDILAWNPVVGGPVIWATAASLGLPPGSDIDALAVTYLSGFPLPSFAPGPSGRDFGPAGDIIVYSLAPGSPPLAPTSGGAGLFPSPCFGAGTATAGDLFVSAAPFGPVIPWLGAEQLGLGAIRSGGLADDNVDAIDICNVTLPALDTDADTVVDQCDFDDDGDGIGDAIDTDADGDGFLNPQQTLHRGPSNTDPLFDNCPTVANPTQTNTDGNFIGNSPPYMMVVDDRTLIDSDPLGDACDTDDDNDGLLDVDEPTGAACAGFVTVALVRDTDADRYLDGAECLIGTDPASSASRPTAASCAAFLGVLTTTDTDGDKLRDYIEFCHYSSDTGLVDGDGDSALDGSRDGCEAASFNGDRIVNVADMGMLASAISNPLFRIPNIDVNKDGAWNPADSGLVASFISPSGQCP